MTERNNFPIRKVAVLGAGVMGAQIAAHLINAGVPTLLFDLSSQGDNPYDIVTKSIANLQKLKPSPLGVPEDAALLQPGTYDRDSEQLRSCDLIIEAIAERLDWKEDLYKKIAPFLAKDTILVSNTSGLSINKLADVLPSELKSRFFGVHFFNPPRYMRLVELIPGNKTNLDLLPIIETFLVTTLGKGVIHAKDTPNFIANRVGVFSILATMYHAEQFGIDFEVVDALTGPAIGRPKSATFRTADVVGLDTMGHVIKTLTDGLPNDPWHSFYQTPAWLQSLISQGALGQKTGQGIYRKVQDKIFVIDTKSKDYRLADRQLDPEMGAILANKDPAQKFAALRASSSPQAQFLWSCFRDLFHYSAVHLQEIADNARDVDMALRWGFGWQQGPFELWQLLGWSQVTKWLDEEIAAGKTMVKTPLPAWVKQVGEQGVYRDGAAYSPSKNDYQKRSSLPVYQRQLFPETVIGEHHKKGETIFENDGLRFWQQGDDIGIVSFRTKMNTVNDVVLESLQQAITYAEQHLKGLIIWQDRGNDFSAGANLTEILQMLPTKGPQAVDNMLHNFQQTALRLRYSMIPTVAAVRGRALGGGCELTLHCNRVVAAFETYIGLVEIGVGLLPAGGGTKEFAKRAATSAIDGNIFPYIQKYFKQIAMAEVSSSARDARAKDIFQACDVVVFNPDELLYIAKMQINNMVESGFRPPIARNFPVAGRDIKATLEMQLVNMREGSFISDYDYFLANKIADVLCGGDLDEGTLVNEQWILDLERKVFLEFLGQEKTQERIKYILKTGKPLRN